MTVVPLFARQHNGRFLPPLSGLKLSQVRGYGNMELSATTGNGVAIVPLHMGYIQDKAQNHALCRSALIAAGQKRMFQDACCVQQAQGGYLEGREQWFFILPLQLREEALQLRGQHGYGKLWKEISSLNQRFGLPVRGHLEQLIAKQRAFLTRYQSRFELLPDQTGALFFLRDRLVGLEIAPSATFFQELWMPLVCFCYGVAAMYEETRNGTGPSSPDPFPAGNLQELRERLDQSRSEFQEQVRDWLARTPAQEFRFEEEERLLDLRLYTITGRDLVGQCVKQFGSAPAEPPAPPRARRRFLFGGPPPEPPVEERGELAYASLFARAACLS
jgi:hypothetical protein